MKIINPSWEILTPQVALSIIERMIEIAGRTCYKSEDKRNEETVEEFVQRLVSSGHDSVLEHALITVRFVCDRGVSHELVRHRLASYSQESTRYCNYSRDKFGNQITVVRPPWVSILEGEYLNLEEVMKVTEQRSYANDMVWAHSMFVAESCYLRLLEKGWKPQEARSVLPNSLKTEIIMSANPREWRHVFELRCSKKAHPQMRQLMCPLSKVFHSLLPTLFEDRSEV